MMAASRIVGHAGAALFCISAGATGANAQSRATATNPSKTGATQSLPAVNGAAASSEAAVPGDIVVTAQRRSERLQDVPISVSAASAAQLEAAGIASTQELSVITPGLSVPQTAGYTQPHIRGIGSSTNGPGLEPPVATYIDGVYIAAAPAALLTLDNVERIEVLKGPQGTLFGRNATGGLIQIVTKDPTDKPAVSFNIGYANYDDVTADAYVAGGIATDLSADLAVRFEHEGDGWGINLGTGNKTGDLPHDLAVRTKFMFQPSGATRIRLALDYEDRFSRRDAQHLGSQYPGTFDNAFFGGPFRKASAYDIDNDVDPYTRLKGGGVSLQLNQNIGDHVALQSITAYRRSRFDLLLDLDQTPRDLIRGFTSAEDGQLSQELQLSSRNTGRLTWVAGLFYYHANDRFDPLRLTFGASPVSPVPGVPTAIQLGDRQRTESYAAYAQASYEVLPRTNLTLGGRYTNERRTFDGTTDFSITGMTVSSTPIPPPASGIPSRLHYDNFSYRVALDHHFRRDLLGYVSYSTGFKSGGYNPYVPDNPPYAPETISAMEAGLKSKLFDRRLRLNAAGYYYRYHNIQVGRFVGGNEAVYNAGRARIWGGDVDAALEVAHGLSLTGGFAYTDALFTSFPNADFIVPVAACTPPAGGVCPASAAGKQLPFAPKTTFDLGADYRIETAGGTFTFGATYYRSGRFFAAPDNVGVQPSYDIVNASVSWTRPSGHLSVKVWGKNLGGTVYATSLVEANQGLIVARGAPRTYGGTLGYRF